MTTLRAALLLALVFALGACASPPYSKSGVSRDVAMADYQDCYSQGALDHFTPESKASINKSTRACMKARGYSGTWVFPWW
ncbi:MAG: hypothetical protein ACLGSA_11555 [Acidobacteriota bacterium]